MFEVCVVRVCVMLQVCKNFVMGIRDRKWTQDRIDFGGIEPLSWRCYDLSGELLMRVLEPDDFMPGVRT